VRTQAAAREPSAPTSKVHPPWTAPTTFPRRHLITIRVANAPRTHISEAEHRPKGYVLTDQRNPPDPLQTGHDITSKLWLCCTATALQGTRVHSNSDRLTMSQTGMDVPCARVSLPNAQAAVSIKTREILWRADSHTQTAASQAVTTCPSRKIAAAAWLLSVCNSISPMVNSTT